MCTVSFIIQNEKVIITSSRDEQTTRPIALKPKKTIINDKNILFPKDEKGGGTWFAIDDLGNSVVLLNGGFERHIPQQKYRKSRGLIVLEIIGEKKPISVLSEIDLEDIEPFTILLWTAQKTLHEFIWDGKAKYTQTLSTEEKYIYSSVTLYDEKIRAMRKKWFEDFLEKNEIITPDLMQSFHTNTATENKENGLIINRNEQVKTYSVTQVVISDTEIMMLHNDLLTEKMHNETFQIIHS